MRITRPKIEMATKRRRKTKAQTQGASQQMMLYETRFPASDEHLMRLANSAIRRANIPPEIMTYDECLSSALTGIAVGWERYNRQNWQSSLEWLSMQAYYQIKTDCKKRVREMQRENQSEDISWIESPKTLSPPQEMILEERSEAVNALLSILSRRDRVIVTRIAVHGENFKTVAKRCKISLYQVKKRYLAALDKLRLVAIFAAEIVKDADNRD